MTDFVPGKYRAKSFSFLVEGKCFWKRQIFFEGCNNEPCSSNSTGLELWGFLATMSLKLNLDLWESLNTILVLTLGESFSLLPFHKPKIIWISQAKKLFWIPKWQKEHLEGDQHWEKMGSVGLRLLFMLLFIHFSSYQIQSGNSLTLKQEVIFCPENLLIKFQLFCQFVKLHSFSVFLTSLTHVGG